MTSNHSSDAADSFIRWNRIRRYRWHRRHKEVLILELGWLRRPAMIVPPEQRAAVEMLLIEKLGERAAGLSATVETARPAPAESQE